jgi:riboflavin kinase/FMN adenylyltransferase
VIPFTHDFSLLDHERFAEEVLRDRLNAVLVIVGRNFRYGHRAQGTIETLTASGARLGFETEPSPLVERMGRPVSSSRIRDLLSAGEVVHAERLLGRHPWLDGVIVRGDGRGRELGFATANLACSPHTAFPATGVYAGRAHVRRHDAPAAISVGYNPTFTDDREHLRVEAPPARLRRRHLRRADASPVHAAPARGGAIRIGGGAGRAGAPGHRRRASGSRSLVRRPSG